MTCTKQHDHAQVRCQDCANASAKRGAKSTNAARSGEDRRAEARAEMVLALVATRERDRSWT